MTDIVERLRQTGKNPLPSLNAIRRERKEVADEIDQLRRERDCHKRCEENLEKHCNAADAECEAMRTERDQAVANFDALALEVERLQAELAEWKQAAKVEANLRREFFDERERLRAALRECAEAGAGGRIVMATENWPWPDPEVISRLYGSPSIHAAMAKTLAALKARREHIDILISLIEAERAMSAENKGWE